MGRAPSQDVMRSRGQISRRHKHGHRLFALAALLATLAAVPALAATRHAAMVIDMNSGETLHAEHADEQRYPASLTKMMTIYMAFEQIEAGRLTPSTKLKVSQEAASAAPTKLDLEPGELIAVMDAIKALITKSANDMAFVLAEAMGGTEANFAAMMTQKARMLGMNRTTFRNAHGLPDPGQVTTARDMLILAMRLQDDFPRLYPLFATKAFTYNSASYRNHNTLLGTFEGVDGIKTGYTRMSGFNLVTSLRRGERHLVAAVFGGLTAGTRNVTMRTILSRSLLRASTKKTRKTAPVVVAIARSAPVSPTRAAARVKPTAATAQVDQPAAPPVRTPRPLSPVAAAPTAAITEAVPPPPSEPTAEPARLPESTVVTYEVAKVRPVMVAARVRTFASPEMQPAEGGAAAGSSPISQTTSTSQTTVIAKSPAAMPARGAPPTSLQAQAQNLAAGVAAVSPQPSAPQFKSQQFAMANLATPSRLRGPSDTPPTLSAAVPRTGFHIQVGAFTTVAEAERLLKDARDRSQGLLAAAKPLTSPVTKDNRQMYRARFAGFDAQAAANTCLELRRLAIDCFVMKAD